MSFGLTGRKWIEASANGDVRINGKVKPLITVVTVVFNGASNIEETILSVLNQTRAEIEYIIIDGGSTDGTVDVIRKYESMIDYWISERDKGIYDAMNKGIMLARGEWINFMNCGDSFYASDTIAKVFEGNLLGKDIVYGSVALDYGHGKVSVAKPIEFESGDPMTFCH